MRKVTFLYFIFWIIFFSSCTEEAHYIPKPRGFPRVEFPEPQYRALPDTFPYSFEYSAHAKLFADSSFVARQDQDGDSWIELNYPKVGGSVHISYKAIGGSRKRFEEYINDSHTLAQKHNIRASAIEERLHSTTDGNGVAFYRLEGDVPTHFQMAITDSSNHFFRASIYVPTSLGADSLAPHIEYLKADLFHMLNTFEWKEN